MRGEEGNISKYLLRLPRSLHLQYSTLSTAVSSPYSPRAFVCGCMLLPIALSFFHSMCFLDITVLFHVFLYYFSLQTLLISASPGFFVVLCSVFFSAVIVFLCFFGVPTSGFPSFFPVLRDFCIFALLCIFLLLRRSSSPCFSSVFQSLLYSMFIYLLVYPVQQFLMNTNSSWRSLSSVIPPGRHM